jgi:hypothetical protein
MVGSESESCNSRPQRVNLAALLVDPWTADDPSDPEALA